MWQKESGKWMELGLFQRAVELLRPKADGIHVDIASGNGAMLATLNSQYPDLKLIGVERYDDLLYLAQRNFKKSGIKSVVLDNPSIDSPGHELYAKVTLIRDKIQSLDLLKKILGGQKVSSASFMFPGITKISAVQPVEQKQELELLNLMAEFRQKVCQCLSDIVVPGGRMVLAEKTTPESLSDDRTDKMMRLMGDCKRYWDFDETQDSDVLYGVDDEISGVRRIDTFAQKMLDYDEELMFLILSSRRNVIQYGEEEPKFTDRQKRNTDKWKRILYGIFRDRISEE